MGEAGAVREVWESPHKKWTGPHSPRRGSERSRSAQAESSAGDRRRCVPRRRWTRTYANAGVVTAMATGSRPPSAGGGAAAAHGGPGSHCGTWRQKQGWHRRAVATAEVGVVAAEWWGGWRCRWAVVARAARRRWRRGGGDAPPPAARRPSRGPRRGRAATRSCARTAPPPASRGDAARLRDPPEARAARARARRRRGPPRPAGRRPASGVRIGVRVWVRV